MPYAENQDVHIYYEVEGQGLPLVLAHGGSDSLEMWRKYGYTDFLAQFCQLILFDFRGHGKSEKPRTKADYGPNMADDIVAILDSLGIYKAHYLGYSLGATAGFHLAVNYPKRFFSFTLGGVTPYAWPDEMVLAVNTVIDSYKLKIADPDAYVRQMEGMLGHAFSPEERTNFLSGDTEADMAVLSSLLEWPPLSNQDLAKIVAPCFVYCGELDPFHKGAQECVEYIPQANFLSMTGFNHITAFTNGRSVLPYVHSFLSAISG